MNETDTQRFNLLSTATKYLDMHPPLTSLKCAEGELGYGESGLRLGLLNDERFAHQCLTMLADLTKLSDARPACAHTRTHDEIYDNPVADFIFDIYSSDEDLGGGITSDPITGLDCNDSPLALLDELIDNPACFIFTEILHYTLADIMPSFSADTENDTTKGN